MKLNEVLEHRLISLEETLLSQEEKETPGMPT